jgi:hypothetical protein
MATSFGFVEPPVLWQSQLVPLVLREDKLITRSGRSHRDVFEFEASTGKENPMQIERAPGSHLPAR